MRKANIARWAGRLVFIASLFALLATSKPKGWSVKAGIVGPMTPSAGHALAIAIDATQEPHLHASHLATSPYADGDTPCLDRWTSGKKVTCLLPPGAILEAVDITGSCGGCKSGCPAPPGAAVTATTTDVEAWTDTTSATFTASLPLHDKDSIATRFTVLVSGAEFVRVAFVAKPKGRGPIPMDDQSCRLEPTGGRTYCLFLVFDSDIPGRADVDVEATATGWGVCAAPGCSAPKTLHVDSLTVTK